MTPPPPDEHIVPADDAPDAAVLTRFERAVLFGLWLCAGWLPVLFMWVGTGFEDFVGAVIFWLLALAVTAPLVSRALGHVGTLVALPPETRPLTHLTPALAGLVREAAAIREDLGHDLEAALGRAWILTCEFDQLPADQQASRERSHAALAPLRALFDQRARARRTHANNTRRTLAAALAAFETSLAEPTAHGFR